MTKNKLLPILYYALLGIFAVCLFSLGLADTQNTGDRYRKNAAFDVERAYSDVERMAYQPHNAGSAAQVENLNYVLGELAKINELPAENVKVTSHTVTYEGTAKEVRDPYDVHNVLVELPGGGVKSGQTVLIMGHRDSVAMGPGAGDDTSSVAAMLETIRQTAGMRFDNRIVFLITDSEEREMDGARLAIQQGDLDGYNLRLVANFECRGTGGSQIMFETSKNNGKLIAELKKLDGGFYTNSIANFIYNNMPNFTDLTEFLPLGVAGLNFANIGEGYNYHTQNDNAANLDKSYLAQVGTTMGSLVGHFGNIDLNKLYETNSNAVFFNYLDWFTVSYSPILALVFGIVTLGILAAVFILNKDTKFYSYRKFGVGMAVLGIALVLTVLLLLLFNLIMQIFGTYGVMVNSDLYASLPLFAATLLIACIVSILVYHFLGRLLKTDSRHITLAGSCVIAFFGAVLSIIPATSELSFLFACTGFLAAAGCLAHTIFGSRGGLDKINLPLAALVVTIPIVIGILAIAGDALGAVMYPYIGTIAALYLSLALPQVDGFSLKIKKVTLTRFSVCIAMGITALALLIADGAGNKTYNIATNLSGHRTEYYDDTLVFRKDLDAGASYAYLYDYDIYPYVKGEVGTFTRQADKTYRRDVAAINAERATAVDVSRRAEDGKTYYTFRVTGFGARGGEDAAYNTIDYSRQIVLTLPMQAAEGKTLINLDSYGEGQFVPYVGGKATLDFRLSYDTVITVCYEGEDYIVSEVPYREIYRAADKVEQAVGSMPEYAAAKSVDRLRTMLELYGVQKIA